MILFKMIRSVQLLSHVQLFATHEPQHTDLPVHHQLLELAQLVSIESVMSSNHLILCHPLLFLPSIFPSIRVFSMSQFFPPGGQSIGASGLASVLPVNIQGQFPLELAGLISLQSKGLSRVFSNTTVQKHQFFSLLYGPALTSVHDFWY